MAANGFQATRVQGVGVNCGEVETYALDSSNTIAAIGDVFQITNSADADGLAIAAPVTTNPYVNQILGVAVGFNVDPTNLLTTGKPANAGGFVQINIDNNQLYRVDVTGQALTIGEVGANFDVLSDPATSVAGNTNLISSNMTILGTTTGVGGAATPFRLVGLDDIVDGQFTTAIVRPNYTTSNTGATGQTPAISEEIDPESTDNEGE